jgi:hypothetical protein
VAIGGDRHSDGVRALKVLLEAARNRERDDEREERADDLAAVTRRERLNSHECNYGLYNTLAGARVEEKRAAEEAAKKSSK